MKITQFKIGLTKVPLRHAFKTALRTVSHIENIVVELITDTGHCGIGEAPPTAAVTGDTAGGIICALKDYIAPKLLGRDISDFQSLCKEVQGALVKNTSAKAAADCALWDLYAQSCGLPVYKLLGGGKASLETDITISVNTPEEMAADTAEAVARGFTCLKVKVGINPLLDVQRLEAVRRAAGPDILLRADANQAWTPKQAVRLLCEIQEKGINLELIEQPVPAHDLDGLCYVTQNSLVPVMADESVFSAAEALRVMQLRAADYINIKLMKCGGLTNALNIVSAAEIYGVECMMGCMLETQIAANAAASLACAKPIITKIDLDGPVLCAKENAKGGAVFNNQTIELSQTAGFGIKNIIGLEYIN